VRTIFDSAHVAHLPARKTARGHTCYHPWSTAPWSLRRSRPKSGRWPSTRSVIA
jgi:hypothetical protein